MPTPKTTYTYFGPTVRIPNPSHPSDLLLLRGGQSYVLPEGSLPGLMDDSRSMDVGKLVLTPKPTPKTTTPKAMSPAPAPPKGKPDNDK
ncbi:MAG: hypothetical protein ACHWZW_02925 [Spirulina sp.]